MVSTVKWSAIFHCVETPTRFLAGSDVVTNSPTTTTKNKKKEKELICAKRKRKKEKLFQQ